MGEEIPQGRDSAAPIPVPSIVKSIRLAQAPPRGDFGDGALMCARRLLILLRHLEVDEIHLVIQNKYAIKSIL